MPGRFIVLEGIDSSILADEAEQLARWVRTEGQSFVITREPTDGPLGAQLRALLNGRLSVPEYAKALLFAADRLDHYEGLPSEEIGFENKSKPDAGLDPENKPKPSKTPSVKYGIKYDLEAGRFVISVRYLLSAYAQFSEQVSLDWLMKINALSTWPDLTIFIDVPVDVVLTRQIKEHGYDKDKVEDAREDLVRQRKNYLDAIASLKEKDFPVEVIESDSLTVIHRNCIRLLTQRFGME